MPGALNLRSLCRISRSPVSSLRRLAVPNSSVAVLGFGNGSWDDPWRREASAGIAEQRSRGGDAEEALRVNRSAEKVTSRT